MDPELAQKVRGLLEAQRIASLGTLHDGEPYVSMVPFAIPAGTTDFIIHVSKLAAHTKHVPAAARSCDAAKAQLDRNVRPEHLHCETVAELAPDVKNRVSHRAQAAERMLALLRDEWRLGADVAARR